jgi:hypothetical protein
VLDDPRSWRGTRRWRFELVPVGQSATLQAYIVTPDTTDRLCAPYLTGGEVSCQNGDRVVLNANRWVFGVDSYGSDLINYRRYLVNHEFGHALGKHHLDCPSPGRLAPVMMQQTKGIGACRKTHGRCPAKIELNRVWCTVDRLQKLILARSRSSNAAISGAGRVRTAMHPIAAHRGSHPRLSRKLTGTRGSTVISIVGWTL